MSSSLEGRILKVRKPWWRFLFHGQIRVPVPIALCVICLMAAEAWWLRLAWTPAPRIVTKTEQVEIPVMQERVVTKLVYRNRPILTHTPEHALTFQQLKPVGELRPRIIRGEHAQK